MLSMEICLGLFPLRNVWELLQQIPAVSCKVWQHIAKHIQTNFCLFTVFWDVSFLFWTALGSTHDLFLETLESSQVYSVGAKELSFYSHEYKRS